MHNNTFLTCLVISSLLAFSSCFFIKPSIYSYPPANKLVCQNYATDLANAAYSSSKPIPYLKCADEAILKITTAFLVTTTPEKCPLQYTYKNEVETCEYGSLINNDVTSSLKQL